MFKPFALRLLWLLTTAGLLSACSPSTSDGSKSAVSDTVESHASVLVRVEGHPITEDDLDAAIIRTVGELGAFQLGEDGRTKVLQSLVMSKAMSLKQSVLLTTDETQEVDRMVTAYREELLTKRYLKNNVSPVPVSETMVKDYYQKYPEKFGGKTLKSFEVVKGMTKLDGTAREKMLKAMTNLKAEINWKKSVLSLKSQGLQIEYSVGAVIKGVLTSDIDSLVHSLKVNEVSTIHFIKGVPMIFKVVKETIIEPKPLADVRATIRKSLAPVQFKKAVKKITEVLLKNIDVEYANN